MNPPPPMSSEFQSTYPPSPSEFQDAARGMGMDTFWNHPLKKDKNKMVDKKMILVENKKAKTRVWG